MGTTGKKSTVSIRVQRFKEIQEGKAYLSLMYWLDKPYKSPQEEFLRLESTDGIVHINKAFMVTQKLEENGIEFIGKII